MTRRSLFARIVPALLAIALAGPALAPAPAAAQGARITAPESFFGFQMGADRKLARWDRLVEYYRLLEGESDRMRIVDMGPSTEGHPFLMLIVSSPANLARLEELRQINARLSDPRGLPQAEIDRMVEEGRAVTVQSFGLHSTEVSTSQTAAEFTYELLSRTDEETTRILDNVVSILIPMFNPDGNHIVTDWYNRWVGTPFEGSRPPVLYHKYMGHDNNRDAFQTNLVESQYGAKILFRDWIPQAYVDHHQMGAYGPRIVIPPYAEPIRPDADPLVWREMSWYGAHMAYKEEEEGLSGVVNAAIYSGWGHFGFHWITPFHNIAGMLTESASASLATPLYIHPEQLEGERRGLPAHEAQTTYPNPWNGGWWTVRDMVERQKVSAWALLDLAAKNREMVLRNAANKALRQTERGAQGETVAFVVPAEQHDPLTSAKMVNQLLVQGIEVKRAAEPFTQEGRLYGAGSYVVSMAQPKMGVVRWLLGRTFYPDNSYTRDREGNPIEPYDMSADVMAEFMGVRVDPVGTPVGVPLTVLADHVRPQGRVERGAAGYVLDGRLNDSFRAVNRLLQRDVPVRRVSAPAGDARPGDFVVTEGPEAVLQEIARQTGVDFAPLPASVTQASYALRPLRIGMYQRYGGGNMDEGWTRFLLEKWEFPYSSVMDAEIERGNLASRYDVLILPEDDVETMMGPEDQEDTPPEYRIGFGEEGVRALEAFVESGGTLVTFAEAGDLAIDKFELPVRNVVEEVPSTEFWSPGSTLRVSFHNDNPLAYGMPEEGLVAFLEGNQVYEVLPTARNERVERIVSFLDRDLLQSGWLIGEERIAEKPAMLSVGHGEGRVVLIGFRTQHRVQTHGTFKLLFNALVSPPPASAATNTESAQR